MEPNANDKARKVAEEALNRLSAELEAGRSEGLKSYLAAMSRFRRYSWGNVLLIASQRPTATHVVSVSPDPCSRYSTGYVDLPSSYPGGV